MVDYTQSVLKTCTLKTIIKCVNPRVISALPPSLTKETPSITKQEVDHLRSIPLMKVHLKDTFFRVLINQVGLH